MSKNILLLAIDGLMESDLTCLCELPPFASLFDRTALVSVKPIDPSATCASAVSLITGQFPDRHGVVGDAPCAIGEAEPVRFSLRSANKAKTLFALAKAAGLKTAAVAWPVSEGDADADFLVAETDDAAAVAAAIGIMQNGVDFMALHLHSVLESRMQYGTDSAEANAALSALAQNLAELLPLAKQVLLVGAVGVQSVSAQTNPNTEFLRAGLISLDERGDFADYKAWCQSNGASAYVYLKNPSNMGVHTEVEKLLQTMQSAGTYGIRRVISREDAAVQQRLYGSFSFVICADGQTSFGNGWLTDCEPPKTAAVCGQIDAATNGFLLASGEAFVSVNSDTEHTVPDVAATCAALLGLKLPMCKGKVMTEILA